MGAAARLMLEAAAATTWGVAATDVRTEKHEVIHSASGRRLGFGALVDGARAVPVPAKERLTLKPLSSLPHLGKAIPFADGMAMTTGKAVFGIDASLPGMKIAVIARPPVVGGKVATVESAEAERFLASSASCVCPRPRSRWASSRWAAWRSSRGTRMRRSKVAAR